MSFIYLASAYSHNDLFERETRYLQACRATAHFMSRGQLVYSPIVHNHVVAQLGKLPTDFDYWMQFDLAMLKLASKLVILRTEGLAASKGVQMEKEFAEQHNIPWEYL